MISLISYIGFAIIVAIFIPLFIRWYAKNPPQKGKLVFAFCFMLQMTIFAYIMLFYICEQNGHALINFTNVPLIVPFALFLMPFVPIVLCPYFEEKNLIKQTKYIKSLKEMLNKPDTTAEQKRQINNIIIKYYTNKHQGRNR